FLTKNVISKDFVVIAFHHLDLYMQKDHPFVFFFVTSTKERMKKQEKENSAITLYFAKSCLANYVNVINWDLGQLYMFGILA
ncbi:hypothetical protein ACJX0J_033224, partial [Zea mays]